MSISLKQFVFGLAAVFALIGLSGITASAAAAKPTDSTKATAKPTDISGALSQSYNADSTVQVGMIVQLKEKDSTTVLPVSSKNVTSTYGVVIPVGKAPIVLSPKVAQQQQVLVATSGRQTMLVSNQSGPIRIGDYITVSAIDGVGMKASQDQQQVAGKAAAAFTGSSNVVGTIKLKDSAGHETAVAISRIQVDVNITHNPLFSKTVDYVPGFLNSLAVAVAGKPISVARIYLCTLLLLITAYISGTMLYSGVRSGMIAVGRNPLSKKSIIASLIQTVIAGLIIFVVGVLAVYLLLKL